MKKLIVDVAMKSVMTIVIRADRLYMPLQQAHLHLLP